MDAAVFTLVAGTKAKNVHMILERFENDPITGYGMKAAHSKNVEVLKDGDYPKITLQVDRP